MICLPPPCKNRIAALCRILFAHSIPARIITIAIENCKRKLKNSTPIRTSTARAATMGELSHQRGGGETPEADRACRPGNEGKAPLSPAHLMQKRALIAMQYSALHHRTWITPTVQKPCRNRALTPRQTKNHFIRQRLDGIGSSDRTPKIKSWRIRL